MQRIKESTVTKSSENSEEAEQILLLDLFLQKYTSRKTGPPRGRNSGKAPAHIKKSRESE